MHKLFRKIFIFFAIILGFTPVIIVGLIGLWILSVKLDQADFRERLNGFPGEKKTELLLKGTFDFEWDKVCIFPPYSIVSYWKTYFPNIEEPSVNVDDGVSNIIFVNKSDVETHDYYHFIGGETSGIIECSESPTAKLIWVDELEKFQKKSELYEKRKKLPSSSKEYKEISNILYSEFKCHRGVRCVILVD